MAKPFKPRPGFKFTPKEDNPFNERTLYVPVSLDSMLKALSEKHELPISRLICIAIDNELDVDVPFNYPCFQPESPYVEFAYAEEAGKILKFLEKFPTGTGRDMLMLCRRDIGIDSRAEFMLGYRELLEKKMIEEFRPLRTKFRYGRNYMYTRIRNVEAASLRRARYKKPESEEA